MPPTFREVRAGCEQEEVIERIPFFYRREVQQKTSSFVDGLSSIS